MCIELPRGLATRQCYQLTYHLLSSEWLPASQFLNSIQFNIPRNFRLGFGPMTE